MSISKRIGAGVGLRMGALLLPAVLAGVAGAQSFTRITTGVHVSEASASRAVAWIDYDSDGHLDLFVTNGPPGGQNNFLYHNDGLPGFGFTKVSGQPIVEDHGKSDGATWADHDNDGDLDCFVVNWYGDNNLFYENLGSGTFSQVLSGAFVNDGGHSETASFGDQDRDGWVDLYVTNSGNGPAEANFHYRNNGDQTFSRITTGPQATDVFLSRGVNWVDYDGDGDDDLFVTNESSQNENLYRNELVPSGQDDFTAITVGDLVNMAGSTFSASWADYDNDGDLDCFVANSGNQNNQLFVNDGVGGFTRLTGDIVMSDGGWSVVGAFGDFENDGDLDLFVSNAFGGGAKRNFLYKNRLRETGIASFEKITTGGIALDLGWTYGFSWGDFDEDGDLDLFQARTFNDNEVNALYRNDNTNGNHWLEVRCLGVASNRAALGAKVSVSAMVSGSRVRQLRVIEGANAYCSQNLDLHFGLGDAAVADTIEVEWPSGAFDLLTGVALDRRITIEEGGVVTAVGESILSRPRLLFGGPNPFRSDFHVDYVLPRAGSVRLGVFDPTGREVTKLFEGHRDAGRYAARFSGLGRRAGVYFLRYTASEIEETQKLVLLP